MKFKDIFGNVRKRVQDARRRITGEKIFVPDTEGLEDEKNEDLFRRARATRAPEKDKLPVDFRLRQSSIFRRVYEQLFPVSHVFRISSAYGREFLDEFMPLDVTDYIGRGSYKFVYRLPWRMVLKVGKEVFQSDPLFGSMFRNVAENPERFLSPGEIELWHYLSRKKGRIRREKLDFQFYRLGLERYHYRKVRDEIPDLVLPTRYFMGVRYRRRPFTNNHFEKIIPMDVQIMLVGKHLKEFASAVRRGPRRALWSRFSPRYDFEFDIGRFSSIKKKVLLKIAEDFRRLIRFTERLALREKLILDIHSENIIITLPEFELKVFDFHLFDEHLYEPSLKFDRPEKDHIEVIERFIESLDTGEER